MLAAVLHGFIVGEAVAVCVTVGLVVTTLDGVTVPVTVGVVTIKVGLVTGMVGVVDGHGLTVGDGADDGLVEGIVDGTGVVGVGVGCLPKSIDIKRKIKSKKFLSKPLFEFLLLLL